MLAACVNGGGMDAQDLENRLESDLPLGSPVAEVAAYLNANDLSDDGSVETSQLMPAEDGAAAYDLLAIRRGTGGSGPVRSDLQMRFLFDEARTLTGITVREVHTGP